MPQKMHANEIETSIPLVKNLLRAQFPQWADLAIARVDSAGTDNALYRLGDDKVLRLPRIDWAVAQIEKDRAWLAYLAPQLPLAIPHQLAQGQPGAGYPWPWSVYRWLRGETALTAPQADSPATAVALAEFIIALQKVDATDGPPPGYRGQPLARRDAPTRQAIREMQALEPDFPTEAIVSAWETALAAPNWQADPVWFHGDLLPGNLLFEPSQPGQPGQLKAVIDFGALGLGDPACDLLPAWSHFSPENRAVFQDALGLDAATWARGRGWALSIGLIILPYYHQSNPVLAGVARRMLAAVLET